MTHFGPIAGKGAAPSRTLLYSHDTYGLGHLRRSRTIAMALVQAEATGSALIVTGSPIAGRFDFPARVDHVRLPGVIKLSDGSYTPSTLRMGIDEMAAFRSGLIETADKNFRPDLIIVDKEPWGLRQELATTLAAARARGARIVLGLRDVLDDPAALAQEWERKRAFEAIAAFYDEVWVYGLPQINRPLAGIGLDHRLEECLFYTGYLRRELPEWRPQPAPVVDPPYVLVTAGGGGDGAAVFDWVLRAYEHDRRLPVRALLVYGPFLPADERLDFDRRAANLGGCVTTLGFHPQFERLLKGACGVVCMGGYNTFCELLSMDRPAVICPRTRPRQEQLVRARAAERLGLARMLTPARDGNGAEVMAAAMRALPEQPRPSEAKVPGLLSGLEKIVARTLKPSRSRLWQMIDAA